MLYLSWSVVYLVVVLVVWAFLWYVCRKSAQAVLERREKVENGLEVKDVNKYITWVWTFFLVVILAMAVRVGDNNAKHYRVNYDNVVDTKVIDKVESTRTNRADVQEAFNKSVGK